MTAITDDIERTVDRIVGSVHNDGSGEAGTKEPQQIWAEFQGAGMTHPTRGEDSDGAGLPLLDAMTILGRTAYRAMPLPVAETMLGGRMLMLAGLEVPTGPITVAPVSFGDEIHFTRHGAQALADGVTRRVPFASTCRHLVIAGRFDGGEAFGLIELSQVAGALKAGDSSECNLAGEERRNLRFEATPVIAVSLLPGARAWLRLEGALYRSVQMAAAIERVLELSLAYIKERKQFGRTLSQFQAVRQLIAVQAGHLAAARAAVGAAVHRVELVGANPGCDLAAAASAIEFDIAVAKARVGEAAGFAADIAHQLHGAMGYTQEHGLHRLTRRLWSWRDEFGAEPYWQALLGRTVCAMGSRGLWERLTEVNSDDS